MTFIPSKYQSDIFDAIKNTNKNIVVSATAGSGKSTTLVQALNYIPKYKATLFLAFNKSIVEELRTKVPPNIEVATLHSFGCKALYSHYQGQVKINEYKTLKASNRFIDQWGIKKKDKFAYQFNLARLIDLYRMNLLSSAEELLEASFYYDVDCMGKEVEHAIELFKYLQDYQPSDYREKIEVDFTDMIYLAVNDPQIILHKFDVVAIDESQDLNKAQQKMIEKILKPGARVLAIGDPQQSIYSFLGADVQSFERLQQRPNTITLPLSVSYRCAKNIVNEARKIYDTIEFYENNEDGVVRDGKIEEIQSGDFVLCRNNRPLIALYLEFLIAGKKAYIRGKDIGKGLLALVSKVRDFTPIDAIAKLNEMLRVIDIQLKDRGILDPTLHPRHTNLEEKISIIEMILEKYESIDKVYKVLESIFKDDSTEGIQLSTIHGVKGLENDRVFIIRPDLLGGNTKYIKHHWQETQERNLIFVAITRAKKELIYIPFTEWCDK